MGIYIDDKSFKITIQVITDKKLTGRCQFLSLIKIRKSLLQVITNKKFTG
jgi:hypothetical protein